MTVEINHKIVPVHYLLISNFLWDLFDYCEARTVLSNKFQNVNGSLFNHRNTKVNKSLSRWFVYNDLDRSDLFIAKEEDGYIGVLSSSIQKDWIQSFERKIDFSTLEQDIKRVIVVGMPWLLNEQGELEAIMGFEPCDEVIMSYPFIGKQNAKEVRDVSAVIKLLKIHLL